MATNGGTCRRAHSGSAGSSRALQHEQRAKGSAEAKIGQPLAFKVSAEPGSVAFVFAAPTASFQPTPMGTWLLGMPSFLIGSVKILPEGVGTVAVGLPLDERLVGLTVLGQAMIWTEKGSLLTNLDLQTISRG